MGHYRVKMMDAIPTCKIEGCEESCRPLTNRPGKFFTLCLEHQRERDRQYSKAYIERDPNRFRANQKALNGGGDGSWMNLTAACKKCNSSKHDKSLLGWLR